MKLQRWYAQVNYEGIDYSDYFIAAQRFFRCGPLERATFAYIREHMHATGEHGFQGSLDAKPAVIDVTFQDECLIARYMVLVHKDFERGVRMAQMFLDRLERKGYVDPDSVDLQESDADDDTNEIPRIADPPFNAAEPTGRYNAINTGAGLTTLSVQRLSRAQEKETAARERVAAEIAQITGGPTPLVARRIDGISRLWTGVKSIDNDEQEANPIER